ncbi:glycosyltransferase family 4 protein, partial [bacterium]|nr:glycosyltransferase family 4 protein [bacterium]
TYLSNSAIPSRTANSVHVMKMCQAFCVNGHQTTLYARPGSIDADALAHYGVGSAFDIDISNYPSIPGINHLLYSREIARKVTKQLLPDVLYARHIYSLYTLRNIGSQLIYEAHSPPANPLQKFMEGQLFKHNFFKRLIVISDALGKKYLQIYPHLKSEQILVVHDAADPIEDNPKTNLSDIWPGRPDVLQVGYTGHLYPGKGMEIIALLAARIPDMDFHVIGGTDADLSRWKNANPTPNLHFHGFIPHGSLAPYYQLFDVMVAPYQKRVAAAGNKGNIAAWMSPLKLFEYMSAHKAIICSDLPVLREILQNRVTALLVEPDNLEAWEQALISIRDENELKELLASKAYEIFINTHTWRKRAAAVLTGATPHLNS